MNKAIVICYTGRNIEPDAVSAIQEIITSSCGAMPELMTIKAFDEDSIAKALLKKSAEDLKISFTGDHHAKHADTVCITFDLKDCGQRLNLVKYIKEVLDCSLKDAKDMIDCGRIYVPKSWDDPKIYQFIKTICAHEGVATGGMRDVAMIQAAIFLNETYSTKDRVNLVRDFAAATYHSHTNSVDEEERALLAAVELVKNNPTNAVRWMSPELVNVVNSL